MNTAREITSQDAIVDYSREIFTTTWYFVSQGDSPKQAPMKIRPLDKWQIQDMDYIYDVCSFPVLTWAHDSSTSHNRKIEIVI